MAERSHLSIGEVLSLLREEFPDVTISKIRFLESQGLVDPERTPSGYRKFYEHDVERLRWILRQQREHFLPLKVIRGRLSEPGEEGDEQVTASFAAPEGASEEVAVRSGLEADAPSLFAEAALFAGATSPAGGAAGKSVGGARRSGGAPRAGSAGAAGTQSHRPADDRSVAAKGVQPVGPSRRPSAAPTERRQEPVSAAKAATESAADEAGPAQTPSAATKPTKSTSHPSAVTPSLFASHRAESAPDEGSSRRAGDSVDEADSYSVDELAAAVGATPALVTELKQFGLITAHAVVAGTPYFDKGSLPIVRAASEFARHGVEVRHLRAWRNAADREAGLFEQIVLPLLRQRNPQSRRHAAATLDELAQLGSELRSALVEQAIREIK
jgi:DNA-binding transcriptional MerR regulator